MSKRYINIYYETQPALNRYDIKVQNMQSEEVVEEYHRLEKELFEKTLTDLKLRYGEVANLCQMFY